MGKFSQAVAAVGGQENAFTSHGLHRLLPAGAARESGKTMMEFEADRMTGLVLQPTRPWLPELKVVLEE